MLMTLSRGCPSVVYSSRCTSSGSPCIQAAKPGEAITLLICIASAIRSRCGATVSRSMMPILSNGGCCTCPIRAGSVSDFPCPQWCARMFESRMCSGERIGSGSMSSSVSSPLTAASIASWNASPDSRTSIGGAAIDLMIASGRPADDPGV